MTDLNWRCFMLFSKSNIKTLKELLHLNLQSYHLHNYNWLNAGSNLSIHTLKNQIFSK